MDASSNPHASPLLPPAPVTQRNWAARTRSIDKWGGAGVAAYSGAELYLTASVSALTFDPGALFCLIQGLTDFTVNHIIDEEKRIYKKGGPAQKGLQGLYERMLFGMCKHHITRPMYGPQRPPKLNLKLFAFKGARFGQAFGVMFAGYLCVTTAPVMGALLLACATLKFAQYQNLINYEKLSEAEKQKFDKHKIQREAANLSGTIAMGLEGTSALAYAVIAACSLHPSSLMELSDAVVFGAHSVSRTYAASITYRNSDLQHIERLRKNLPGFTEFLLRSHILQEPKTRRSFVRKHIRGLLIRAAERKNAAPRRQHILMLRRRKRSNPGSDPGA